jgi:DNA-binding transcriptional regulator GbsR (MarR family)
MTKNYDHELMKFIEDMGLLTEGEGLPRIAGRIIGLLMLEDDPVSFSMLSDRLKVSRASVSTNTRLLQSLGVIERTTQPGERQDYFQISRNPYLRFLQGASDRLAESKAVVRRAQSTLGQRHEKAGKRLGELYAYFNAVGGLYETLVARFAAKN